MIKEERKLKLIEINKKWYHRLNEKINSFLKVGIVSLILFLVLIYSDGYINYMEFKKIDCTVMDHVTSQGKNSTTFFLVLKDPQGRLFDNVVPPTDYSQCKNGKTYTMKLREFDIRQTPKKNILYMFVPAILIAFIIAFFSVGIVVFIHNHVGKKK